MVRARLAQPLSQPRAAPAAGTLGLADARRRAAGPRAGGRGSAMGNWGPRGSARVREGPPGVARARSPPHSDRSDSPRKSNAQTHPWSRRTYTWPAWITLWSAQPLRSRHSRSGPSTGNDSLDGRIQPRSLEDPISLEESISADDDGSRKCADEPHDRSPLPERALADVGGARAVHPSLWLWRASRLRSEEGSGESGVGAVRPPRRRQAQRTEQPSERPCLSSVRLHYTCTIRPPRAARAARRGRRGPHLQGEQFAL